MRNYEGMFLLDSARAAKEWDETIAVINSTLERYGATVGLNGKWDERKLAYPIKRQKRGAYYLAYFTAPTDAIAQIRADLLLREEVLRFLILVIPEDVPVPDSIEQKRMIQDDDDDRRGGRGGYGGGGGGGRRRDRDDSKSGSASETPAAAASAGSEGGK